MMRSIRTQDSEMFELRSAPGYCINSQGQIFSTRTNWRGYGMRQMKAHPNSYGYLHVRLTVGNKRKCLLVHKLMAETFLVGRPSADHEMRHIDGNKKNNRVENLRWGTAKENAADRARHGNTSHGGKHSKAITSSKKWECHRAAKERQKTCVNFFHGSDIATENIPEGGFKEMVEVLKHGQTELQRRTLLTKLGIDP